MIERLMAGLVVVCVGLLPWSILEAAWAPRANTLTFVCALSLASGALVAPLRWRRAIRWPIVMLLGLALAASNAGLIRLGGQAAYEQWIAWATDLQAGRIVQDPNLVTFWVTLLIWWAGYSAAHGIASHRPALNALLPTLAALTINTLYTHRSMTYVIVELFGLVILMTWTTLSSHHAQWNKRQLDYPDTQMDTLISGLIVASLVCSVAFLVPTITSKSTLEWLRDLMKPQKTQVQQVAEQLLGGATPIPLAQESASSSSRMNVELPSSRLIGNPPELSYETVMWVWTDLPAPLPEQVRERMPEADSRRPYWRGLTYATYTGRGWSTPLTTTVKPLTSTAPSNLTQRFEIVEFHADTVFAANEPISGTPGLNAVYAGTDLIGLRGTASRYTVTSRLIKADEDALRTAPLTPTAEMTPYLQLPANLPLRVRELAARLSRDAATAYDKAARIEAYLRTYTYTLDLPPVPEGRDLVDYFLFDAPGGYCDYYASAMVVMLRAVGLPARLASGYLTGAYDHDFGLYHVIGATMHSWPEVYLEGIGWIEFEPTASQSLVTRLRSQPEVAILSSEQVRAGQVARQQRETLTRTVALASIAASLSMMALLFYWIRRERQSMALPAEEAIPLLYQRLRRRGKWLGVALEPSDTPDEFIASFNRAVLQSAGTRWQPAGVIAQRSAKRIGELYRRASYSSRPPDENEARQAWSAWRALSPRTGWIGLVGNLKRAMRHDRSP